MDYKDYQIQKGDVLHFWYRARKNLTARLLELLPNDGENKILDIGCGTGTELEVLKKYGQVTALDVEVKALKIAACKGVETLLADINEFDPGKGIYNIVCAFDVLEHLEQDEKIMKKLFSSLVPGGYLVFTVPAHPWLFSPHDEALGHVRRYSKKEIEVKLACAGFKIIKIGYWNYLLFPAVSFFRISKKIINLVARKGEHETETKLGNKYLNSFLFYILNLEASLVSKLDFPFYGLTIYGVAKYEME